MRIPVKPPHKGGHSRFLAFQKRCPDIQKEVLRSCTGKAPRELFIKSRPLATNISHFNTANSFLFVSGS